MQASFGDVQTFGNDSCDHGSPGWQTIHLPELWLITRVSLAIFHKLSFPSPHSWLVFS